MKLSDQLDAFKRITGTVLNDNQEFKTSSEIVDAVNEFLEKNNDTPVDWGKIDDNTQTFLVKIGYKVDLEKKTLEFVEEAETPAPTKKAPVKVTETKGKGASKKETKAKKDTVPKEAGPDWTKIDFEQVKNKTKIENVKVGASRVSLWVGGRVFFKIVGKKLIQKLQSSDIGTCTNATDLIKMINENWPSDAVIAAHVGEKKPPKKKAETAKTDKVEKTEDKGAKAEKKSTKASGKKSTKAKVDEVEPVAEVQVEEIEATEGA